MANNFCRFLSNGYSVQVKSSDLFVKPCCWYQGGIILDENFDHNILKRSKIDNWTPGCVVCKEQESAGQNSFRQSSFNLVPEVDHNNPVALDIHIDMTCNAACVICGPELSTYWDKQLAKEKNTVYIKSQINIDLTIEQIISKFSLNDVRRIKFFGGEPLLTDTHTKILQKIPNPEQVDIWYTTNASVLPKQEVIELWKKFHLVFFEASIDAVAEQFEYIRWPLQWSKISKNLHTLKTEGPVNVLFRINHTLNPFNIFYYDQFEQWVQEHLRTNRVGDDTEINVHPCWGDWGLDKTPNELREQIYLKYPDHLISKILRQQAQNSHGSILSFVHKWDNHRKQNWQKVFPDIAKYFL